MTARPTTVRAARIALGTALALASGCHPEVRAEDAVCPSSGAAGLPVSTRTATEPAPDEWIDARLAQYVNAVHARVHAEFVDRFLHHLPRGLGLDCSSLVATVELGIGADGTLEVVTLVASSGNVHFDQASLDAIARAAPFAPTPETFRSPDGRVWLYWGLHRDDRQCLPLYVDVRRAP